MKRSKRTYTRMADAHESMAHALAGVAAARRR